MVSVSFNKENHQGTEKQTNSDGTQAKTQVNLVSLFNIFGDLENFGINRIFLISAQRKKICCSQQPFQSLLRNKLASYFGMSEF